ncbi:MAG: hypothetical protein BWY92_00898 [Firmicutes bacterium ADurb.BinA052]|nr:MAG: hypothetical protein BWY92_00898 [Firmicutes bacterium ADurb.BinA052]
MRGLRLTVVAEPRADQQHCVRSHLHRAAPCAAVPRRQLGRLGELAAQGLERCLLLRRQEGLIHRRGAALCEVPPHHPAHGAEHGSGIIDRYEPRLCSVGRRQADLRCGGNDQFLDKGPREAFEPGFATEFAERGKLAQQAVPAPGLLPGVLSHALRPGFDRVHAPIQRTCREPVAIGTSREQHCQALPDALPPVLVRDGIDAGRKIAVPVIAPDRRPLPQSIDQPVRDAVGNWRLGKRQQFECDLRILRRPAEGDHQRQDLEQRLAAGSPGRPDRGQPIPVQGAVQDFVPAYDHGAGQVIEASQPCRHEIGGRQQPLRPDHPKLARAGRRVARGQAARKVALARRCLDRSFGDDRTPGFQGFEQAPEQHGQLASAHAQKFDRLEINLLNLQRLDHTGDPPGDTRRRAFHKLRELPQPGRHRLPLPSG